MPRETTSRNALRRQQMTLELSLEDLRRGRRTGHLSPAELTQMIMGLEKRLSEVGTRLMSDLAH